MAGINTKEPFSLTPTPRKGLQANGEPRYGVSRGKKNEINLKFEDQWSGLQGIPRMLQIF